jgi:hypothetical protein
VEIRGVQFHSAYTRAATVDDAHFDTVCDYLLQVAIKRTLASTVTSSLLLLGSCLQQWMFTFLWVPKWSPASDMRFFQEQLTMTEPKQSSNKLTDWSTATESKSCSEQWSVSVGFLVFSIMWGSWSDISYCYSLVQVSHTLWEEEGSVICQSDAQL